MQEIKKLLQAWNLRLLGNDEIDDEDDNPNHGNPDTAQHDAHDDNSTLISKTTRCSEDPDYFKSDVFKKFVANKASIIAELVSKGSKTIQLEIEE